MDVAEYAAYQVNNGDRANYTKDFLGSVRLLEDSGFSPFSDDSPLSSTLGQVFDQFIQKTGLGSDKSALTDDFLANNPTMQRALDLYAGLENTFSSKGNGQKAAIVDFLNAKIDDFIADKDQNANDVLTLRESELNESLFEAMDSNNDSQLESDEIKKAFYEEYKEFTDVLNYFRSTPGSVIDFYA